MGSNLPDIEGTPRGGGRRPEDLLQRNGMLKVRDGVTTISEVTRSVFSLA